MCSPSAPAAPDYAAQAVAQGQANVDAARATGRISNPNIYTPQGSQLVSWDGDTPTVRQSYSPEIQQIYDKNLQSQNQLADLAITGGDKASGILGTQFSTDGIPAIGDSSATRQKVMDAMLARSNTDIEREKDNTRSTLVAQGIPVGSEAYMRAMEGIDRKQTDARNQAEVNAGTLANQQFGQDMSGRQQNITEALLNRQTPINEINAFRTGSQVSTPAFQQFSGANVAPAPVMAGAQAAGQATNNAYNQQTASSNAQLGGLASLGGAAMMATSMF